MSSYLREAKKFLNAASKTDGRDAKAKFNDLCKAVDRIIRHLQETEKEETQEGS